MDININIQDLSDKSIEELRAELLEWRAMVKDPKTNTDIKAQEKYNVQTEISRIKAMNTAIKEEIEEAITGNPNNDKTDEANCEINTIKAKIATLQDKHEINMQSLKNKLSTVRNDIQLISGQLKDQLQIEDDCEMELKENDDLNIQNNFLDVKINTLEEQLMVTKDKKALLINQTEDLKDNIEQVNEITECLKIELENCNKVIDEIQTEMLNTRSEIEKKKNVALEPESRGNSMFTEIHDRKIQLGSKFAKMKSEYLELQGECDTLLKNIEISRSTLTHLTQVWSLEKKKMEENKNEHLHYFIQLVSKLFVEIEERRSCLKEKFIKDNENMSEMNLQTIWKLIIDKEQKLLRILDDIVKIVKKRIDLVYQLQAKNKKIQDLKIKVYNQK